jgi:hypothetical protein
LEFQPDEELDLPSLYWVPKLHKYPYTQHYIAGSAICPKGWCDSDVDTEEIKKYVRVHTFKIPLLMQ